MSTFLPAEKGMTIRQASTANLMVDSADRSAGTAFDFQITRNQSILNGFFTRIGTTEVVLEWFEPNGDILSTLGDMDVDLSGTGVRTVANPFLPGVFYTASDAIDALVNSMNVAFGASTFSVQPVVDGYGIEAADVWSIVSVTPLSARFGFVNGALLSTDIHTVAQPDFRPYRYLDFVSVQLTYNQDLKDSTTSTVERNVLCRWYMAWDNPPTLDPYGYPILMGYEPFVVRRLFNPPKQIHWQSNMPIGNISFQVYTNTNIIVPANPLLSASNWLMTLQVSEN